jgi:transposase
MAGRPTKRTPETEKRLLDALRAGNTRRASCAYAGISDETFANWCKRFLEFLEAVEKAEADAEVRHVANIAKAAGEGVWTASAWWLERRRPKDWGKTDRLELIQTVRLLAEQQGLSEDEKNAAVAEAERIAKEWGRAGAR